MCIRDRRVATTPVTIDNTPPSLVLTDPKPDALYVMEDDEQINANALANDNLALDRVDFLLDDTVFGTSTVSPYNERWRITMQDGVSVAGGQPWTPFVTDDLDIQPGTVSGNPDGFQAIVTNGGVYLESHIIKAVAYDAAGNRTESQPVRVYVRHEKQ